MVKIFIGLLFALFTTGCSAPVVKVSQPAVTVVDEGSLIPGATELKDHRVYYQFPFTLENTDNDANLTLDFIVSDKGHCPVTYIPTMVSVNSNLVKKIDFRDFDYSSRQIISIPRQRKLLTIGVNQVEIRTGECSFDIDVMSLNDMRIQVKK